MAEARHKAPRQGFSLAYRGKHVKKNLAKTILAFALTATSFIAISFVSTSLPASAVSVAESFQLSGSPDGFGLYLDAPRVQGSYLSGTPNSASENFNGQGASNSCPSSIAGATLGGSCQIYNGPEVKNFGSTSSNGDPSFGGSGTPFASTVLGTPTPLTLTFSTPQKYLGFYWSSGSPGNQIDFYRDNVLLSSITTADLMTVLGAEPSSSTPSADKVTAINGAEYLKQYYFGNSNFYDAQVNQNDTLWNIAAPTDPYLYIHAFAAGNTDFDKVVLSGNYFEFDNLVSSSAAGLQPNSSLVPYKFFEKRRVVRFDANDPGAVGSMAPQTGLAPANLSVRGFGLTGYDFYGWNTQPNGSGTWYSDTGIYPFAEDATLYAQWQSKSNKPAIFGLGVRVNEPSLTYSRPDPSFGLAIDWQGLGSRTGNENWFLCDNPHTSPADYFLSAFPSDCVEYPYGSLAGGAPGNVNFPKSQMINGKYIAYGMWAGNSAGTTYAIQSAPNPVTLAIQGLASNSSLTRTAFTVSGYPTSTTSGWYRCDNAFVDDQTMPSGTCTSVNSNALSYTPVLADVGKYMVYKATAAVSGSSLTATKIVSGGPAVVMNRFVDLVFGDLSVTLTNSNATAELTPIPTHPDLTQIDGAWLICNTAANSYVSGPMSSAAQQAQSNLIVDAGCSPIGALQNSTQIPVISNYFGKYVTYFYMGAQTADSSKGLFVYRSTLVPTPAPTPVPSASSSQSASPSPSPSASSSANPGATPSSSPRPTSSATPSAPSSSSSSGSSGGGTSAGGNKSATIHQNNGSIITTYPSGEEESLEEVVIEPESVIELPKATIAASKVAKPIDLLAPVRNSDIGATGDDSAAPIPFAVLESPGSAKSFTKNLSQLFALLAGLTLGGVAISSASRKRNNGAVPDSADISNDPFASSRRAWGDKLAIWNLRIATSIDALSVNSVMKSARISPFFSRVFNDGSYLRAMFGPLTVVAPVLAAVLVINTSANHDGLLANQAWLVLLALSLIAFFDAFAGFAAVAAYAITTFVFTSHVDLWQDLRVLIGTSLVILGPVMVMTAFRTIRRTAARKFSEWWERFVDLAVGPFISGWSATIFVSALPAIAGITLSIANHVLLVGLVTAAAAFVRVLIEEFVASAYPQRLDKVTPNEIPESSKTQKYISLAVRFALWNFMVAGVLGNTWQLWVGSALLLVPSVVSWYHEHIPNSPTLWRILPTGIPGLAFALSVITWTTAALSNLLVNSEQLAKWAFAILPMPIVLFGLLALMGREGEHAFEVKPSKRNKLVYRLGGIVMLVLTVRLAGIV